MALELEGSRSGYSDTQLELMDGFAALLGEHCPNSLIRTLIDDPSAKAGGLWKQLVDAGWTSALYPTELGGQGLGVADVSALLVEAGRVLLPGPFFASAVLAPLALGVSQAGGAALPGIDEVVSGRRIASFALSEAPAAFPALKVETKVGNGRISGVKRFVPDADQADFLLVLAKDGDARAVFAWVPMRADGVEIVIHPTIDGRRLCTVTLDQAAVAGVLLLRADGVRDILLRAALMTASLQLGGAERALAMAAGYAQMRVQFGRPIGAFQAVSHRLVDLYCSVTVGRALLQKAVQAVDHETHAESASRAKIWNNDTYRAVTKGALQTFGGIGFTFEHDIHLYLRSAHALAADFGSSADHRRLLLSATRALRAA